MNPSEPARPRQARPAATGSSVGLTVGCTVFLGCLALLFVYLIELPLLRLVTPSWLWDWAATNYIWIVLVGVALSFFSALHQLGGQVHELKGELREARDELGEIKAALDDLTDAVQRIGSRDDDDDDEE